MSTSTHISAPKFYEDSVFIANDEGIWALDQMSGNVLWKKEFRTTYGGNARIIGVSECCVLVNRVSEDITAYDRITGKQKWTVLGDRGFANAFFENQTIYIVSRGITALEGETGNMIWKDGEYLISWSDYDQGVIYYTYNQGGKIMAFAYNILTQRELWVTPLSGIGPSKALYSDNYVLVSSDDNLFALDAQTGQMIWSRDVQTLQMPVVLDGVIYLMEGFTRSVKAIILNTGEDLGFLSLGLGVLFEVELNNLSTTKDLLIFAEGNQVYSYGK